MDSSLSQQVLAKCRLLTPLAPLMRALEGVTIRRAAVVIPVCDALADVARRSGAKNVIVLNDVSLLGRESLRDGSAAKAALGIQETCFMYIGNLERYQGIDLLLRSFARAVQGGIAAVLIVVGGTLSDIAEYEARSRRLHIAAKVHFCGEAPVEQIGRLITAADVLVSPRLKGSNTPMKIYTYMDSGKAILATAIPAHTQVLASDAALLEPPEVEAFAEGMRQLASDAQLRVQLGARAKALAHDRYSREAFERRVAELCVALESPITHEASGITPRAA
jgi:glycosyltransferase involved in cell wall biosynthesis